MNAVVTVTTREGWTREFTGKNNYRNARRFAAKHGLPSPVAEREYTRDGRKPGSEGPRTVKIGNFEFEPLVTYEELAAELGVSWQRVQAIEKRALEKLREKLEARGFTGWDG